MSERTGKFGPGQLESLVALTYQLTSQLTIHYSDYQALFYFVLSSSFVCFCTWVSCYLMTYCGSIGNIYPIYLGECVPKLSFESIR